MTARASTSAVRLIAIASTTRRATARQADAADEWARARAGQQVVEARCRSNDANSPVDAPQRRPTTPDDDAAMSKRVSSDVRACDRICTTRAVHHIAT